VKFIFQLQIFGEVLRYRKEGRKEERKKERKKESLEHANFKFKVLKVSAVWTSATCT
jgi:hypothetical protein